MILDGKVFVDEDNDDNLFNLSEENTTPCQLCSVNQSENKKLNHATSHKTKHTTHEVDKASFVKTELGSKNTDDNEEEEGQDNVFNFSLDITPCEMCSGDGKETMKQSQITLHKDIKSSHRPTESNVPASNKKTDDATLTEISDFPDQNTIEGNTETDITIESSTAQSTQESSIDEITANTTDFPAEITSEPQLSENVEESRNTSEDSSHTKHNIKLSTKRIAEETEVENSSEFPMETLTESENTFSELQPESFDDENTVHFRKTTSTAKFDHTSPKSQAFENVQENAAGSTKLITEKSLDTTLETYTTVKHILSGSFSTKQHFVETQNESSFTVPSNKDKSENSNEEIQEHIFNFSKENTKTCELCSISVTRTEEMSHPSVHTIPHKLTQNMSSESTSRSSFMNAIQSNSFNSSEYNTVGIDHSEDPLSEPISQSTISTNHSTQTQKTTKLVLETLTETKPTLSGQPSEPDELEDMKAMLTEMGVSNEEFVMHTATENHNQETDTHSLIHTTKTDQFHIDKQLIGATKPVVFIVNNTGKKLKKINESILNNILNRAMDKNIEEVNLEYLDLHKLTEEEPLNMKIENHHTYSSSTNKNEILNNFLSASSNKDCKLDDFNSKQQCLCKVDSYLNILENMLAKVVINEHDCVDFINLHDGIIISNKTEPSTKRKRSLLYLVNNQANTKFIEADIENIFSEDYQINQTDGEILALPDTSIKILCHNKADLLLENKGVTYTWIFTRYTTEDEEVMPGGDITFPIYKLEVKDAGNYTCKKTLSNGETDKYMHELDIITFPVYKIEANIYYALKDSCSLSDGDVLYSYLPKIFGTLLCGQSSKICSVTIDRPLCISNDDDDNFLNVTATATMNSITEILNSEVQNCNINCEMKAYANLVTLTYKNAEIVRKVDVFSRLDTNIDFLTNITNTKIQSPLPRLIITCKGGFGVEKTKQRVCVLCPPNTFSQDNEAFCRVCPIGQYQPTAGSTLCLPCESPVDDIRCLQMLYTDTMLFKIYVGVGFGIFVLLIMIIVFWKASGNLSDSKKVVPYEGSQKQRAFRRRPRDIEKGVLEPLLKNKPQVRINSPPKVPPLDF